MSELKKKDAEIENLKSKINSQMSTLKNQSQAKEPSKVQEFQIINSHEAKSELFSSSGLYQGSTKDFTEFTQKNEMKGFESLKDENKNLREALSEIQEMMVEVAEHRMQIVSSIYRKDHDLENSPNLSSLKTELFSLNSNQLSKHTLQEIRYNISKFKDFLLSLDKQSIGGTRGDDHMTPMPGLEQIPSGSIQADSLVVFKETLETYKDLVLQQDGLIKKAIEGNQRKMKDSIFKQCSKTIQNYDLIENAKNFINQQKDQEQKQIDMVTKAKSILNDVQKRIQLERSNYDVIILFSMR